MKRSILAFVGESLAALWFVLWSLLMPFVSAALLFWLVMGACRGADGDIWRFGDPRENRTETPKFRGVDANAPIPPELHLRNTVGTDQAGLCVPSSVTINGRYQEVPGVESILPLARQRPGGYGPDKLSGLLRETVPDEKYASYVGTDTAVLDKLSADGLPVGATMNTGSLYGWQPIHHMISLTHFDSQKNVACVVDNNQPGVFTWMTAKDFGRRWIDGGTGWAFVWLRKRTILSWEHKGAVAVVAVALVFAALVIRRRLIPLDDEDDFSDA